MAPRKNLTQLPAANPSSSNGYSSEGPSPVQSTEGHELSKLQRPTTTDLPPSRLLGSPSTDTLGGSALMNGMHDTTRSGSLGYVADIPRTVPRDLHQSMPNFQEGLPLDHHSGSSMRQGAENSPTAMSLNGFSLAHEYDRPAIHGMPSLHSVPTLSNIAAQMTPQHAFQSYREMSFPMASPQDHHTPPSVFRFNSSGESPLASFMGTTPNAGSPGWLSLPPPVTRTHPTLNHTNTLRYPVLQPLLSHIGSVIPVSLACDLLDSYFTSSSSVHMHPLSPYLLGYVFRKQSFLDSTRPRSCTPALLSSMLWVAAQNSDAPFLTSPPAARGRICQKLLEITVGLLKPLIHGSAIGETPVNYGANTAINGVALGGLGVAMLGGEASTADAGASGALDDIATYFHLATVISASEYKAASLRWWNAAFSLARELKLGRELPPNPPQSTNGEQPRGEDVDADREVEMDMTDTGQQRSSRRPTNSNSLASLPGIVGEEEREERRRVWWLLYTMDRHLALCYNRPLFLLDVECESLLQPMNDMVWQAGEFRTGDMSLYPASPSSPRYWRRGPDFECTGHSIFGYFLPLMTILGEIVDLNHARNHPRFGLSFRRADQWDEQIAEIAQQLEIYGRSLKDFEARFTPNINDQLDPDHAKFEAGTPSVRSANSGTSRTTELGIQTKIVVAYGTHVMHVLHILLTGKWDPISLLDDNDLWISSQSFICATGHAVSAAEAISDILEYDPDTSFMPFFFGIYLLQGSFLLLLIADKLQAEASPSVVKACETIVRAHEACVVTLNTEYQVR